MAVIETEILQAYGAEKRRYAKESTIFNQGERPRYYYQLAAGEVKMCNYNEDGREFIQGIFSPGRSFGEPPLFAGFNYPAAAVALTEVSLWQLQGHNFFRLLTEQPDIHFRITAQMAERLHYKAMMAKEMSYSDASKRILKLLQYLKRENQPSSESYAYEVELTRQQIADLSGLRVETVIRSIRNLAEQELLKIDQRKIMI